MNICQAGHKVHSTKKVQTVLGEMTIYDWEQYMNFKGYCSGQDDVSKTLDLYGKWDIEETHLINNILSAGSRDGAFVDIGSHVGYFSLLAHQLGYEVFAYEGDLENVQLSIINVPNIKAKGIWFNEKTPKTRWKDKRIKLMKIDIEGNERFAIDYFWKQIEARLVDNIIIEVSPTFNGSYPELLERLFKIGYRAFEIDGRPFDNNWQFSQKDLWLVL